MKLVITLGVILVAGVCFLMGYYCPSVIGIINLSLSGVGLLLSIWLFGRAGGSDFLVAFVAGVILLFGSVLTLGATLLAMGLSGKL